MSTKQYIRRPMVSDAPPEHQQAFFGYIQSNSELVPYELWQAWRKAGRPGRVEDFEMDKDNA